MLRTPRRDFEFASLEKQEMALSVPPPGKWGHEAVKLFQTTNTGAQRRAKYGVNIRVGQKAEGRPMGVENIQRRFLVLSKVLEVYGSG